MKKSSIIPFTLGLLISIVCLPSCRKCGQSYAPVDSKISSCIFKVGSYFIYQDSVDQIIDSEYVYQYFYHPHTLNSSTDGCEIYVDELYMNESSFRNGVSYNDTIFSGNSQPYIMDIYNQKWVNGENCPILDLQSNTTIDNYTLAGTTYPTVYKASPHALILEGSDTVHADLYIAPGYGIIQRIEHRPTGDVPWNLIRYHIVH